MISAKDCLQFEIDIDEDEDAYMDTIDEGVFEDMFVVAGILSHSKGKTVHDVIKDICPDNMVGWRGRKYFPAISLKIAIAYANFKQTKMMTTQPEPFYLQ